MKTSKMKFFLLLLLLMISWGCNGKLYTVENIKRLECCKEHGDYYEGIRIYSPAHFVEISRLTAIVDKGKLEATIEGINGQACLPQALITVVTRPDYTRPMQLVYKPGWLETNTFGVDLKDGLMISVNSSSSPDRGETLKNIVSAVGEAFKIPTPEPTGVRDSQRVCTHHPELKYLIRLEEACPNGKCNFSKYP
jgi:hypothetical protein